MYVNNYLILSAAIISRVLTVGQELNLGTACTVRFDQAVIVFVNFLVLQWLLKYSSTKASSFIPCESSHILLIAVVIHLGGSGELFLS